MLPLGFVTEVVIKFVQIMTEKQNKDNKNLPNLSKLVI